VRVTRRHLVRPCLVGLAAVVLAGTASAAQGPFYLVPSPTKECQGVANCEAAVGPWVAVPASGEATFLFGCPLRFGFLVGGTDARASSAHIRVWFDGQLGASGGFPASDSADGAVLLFHGESDDARSGAFQPILGCVSLKNTSKLATVSLQLTAATPGTPPGPPLDLRANTVVLGAGSLTRTTVRCPGRETLIGSWSAYAINTSGPPSAAYLKAVMITTVIRGGRVHGSFQIGTPLLTPLAPLAWAQVGAMCEP
jgi:hypothetical protein